MAKPKHAAQNFAAQLSQAFTLLEKGQLQKAEKICRRVLAKTANYAPAVHLLALTKFRQGTIEAAVGYIERALELAPRDQEVRKNAVIIFTHSGDTEKTGQCLSALADLKPASAEPYLLLGNHFLGLSQFDTALEHYTEALELNPDLAQAYANMGYLLCRQGKLEPALDNLRRAIELNPRDHQAHNNAGNACLELSRYEEAVRCFQRAIELNQRYVPAHNGLGIAATRIEDYSSAIEAFETALAIQENPETHFHLASAHYARGSLSKAVNGYRRVLELDPGYDAHNKLGIALKDRGDTDEATECFRLALRVSPSNARALHNLGIVEQERGNLPEADRLFRRALAVRPGCPIDLFHLAHCRRHERSDDQDVTRIVTLLDSNDVAAEDLPYLHFALGKMYDDCHEYDLAFRHYQLGNEIKRTSLEHDSRRFRSFVDENIDVFTADAIERLRDHAHDTDRPIFIVGMPRSGTSLVEQIIASHPDIHGFGELDIIEDAVTQISETYAGGAPYPRYLQALEPARLTEAGRVILETLQGKLSNGARRFSDKNPYNFRWIGIVALMFKNAKIIHCRRNALDTCLSNFFQLYRRDNEHTYTLGELGSYFREYRRLMAHWRGVYPERILEIHYESLVGDVDVHARKLIEFLGLPWNDACLAFHCTDRNVTTASLAQVRRPIYTSSSRRWRHYDNHLEPLRRALAADG